MNQAHLTNLHIIMFADTNKLEKLFPFDLVAEGNCETQVLMFQ